MKKDFLGRPCFCFYIDGNPDYKSVGFYQIFRMSSPPLKTFWRWFWVWQSGI